MAWLTGWGFRKSHVINAATGAGTLYQKKIVVHYGSGSDSGEDVYCNSKCKTDFGDIRFTSSDGETELDYWLESKTDSDNAVFWVEVVDDLSSVNQTIYIYYGKANATTMSNGDNTFPVFIGHEEGNLDEWDESFGTATMTAEGTYPHTGSYDMKIVPASGNPSASGRKDSITAYGIGYAYRIWIYDLVCKVTAYALDLRVEWDGGVLVIGVDDNGQLDNYIYYDAGWTTTSIVRTVGQHLLEYKVKTGSILMEIDGILVHTYSGTPSLLKAFALVYRASPNPSYFDDYLIRKWVDPEPAHAAWGEEEQVTLPTNKIFVVDKEDYLFRINPTDLSEEQTISLS